MYSKVKNRKDIRFILNNLRNQDKNELKAKYGKQWKSLVFENINKLDKEHCLIGCTDNNKPVLLYGVVPHEGNIGVVWMLASQDIAKEQISFLKQSKEYIKSQNEKFSLLCNYVHCDNSLAIKWLKWLGFNFEVRGLGRKEFLFFYSVSEQRR